MRSTITTAVLLVLAACGGTGDGGGTTAANTPAKPDGWNAVDACETVGTAAVAQATGKAVTDTELDPVSQPEGIKAGFSMCTFALSDGSKVSVLTREAPDGDDLQAAIATAKQAGAEFGSPPVDVPGLGKAALWTAKPPSLQVFIDDRRYATISLFGANLMPDASDTARAAATSIAKGLAS